MRRISGASFAVVALSACGGHSDNVVDRADPTAIAVQFGCHDAVPVDGGPELYVSDAVSCTYRGDYTTVNVFASSGSEARWRDTAKAFSGGDGTTVVGDGYVVEADTGTDARAIAATLDGTVE